MASRSPSPSGDRLFDLGETEAAPAPEPAEPPVGRTVRVVCDVAAVHRAFDYIVPDRLASRSGIDVCVGTMVRVPLHGRQVAAWIVEVDVESPPGVTLRAVSKISGVGPSADVIELCRWAAWRWVGRLPAMLGAASPPTMVKALPRPAAPSAAAVGEKVGPLVASLYDHPVSLIRLPPASSPIEVIRAGAMRGNVLVVAPTFVAARSLAEGMRRAGITVAVHPDGWGRAAAGCSLVGTRTAAFAPVAGLGAIVVVDEHDETLQNEGSPTWNAREVAVERGRQAGVPVVLVSPTPSLEALAHTEGRVHTIDRARERSGWAKLDVIDRRDDDIVRSGLYSEALVRALQSDKRVVCVLNRTGRAQMLGCVKCGTLATCERCEASVRQDDEAVLHCPRCSMDRPVICGHCSSTQFRPIRIGVTKAREQLETLLREPVDEVAGAKASAVVPNRRPARVVVGTEAVLQRVTSADVVAFLEFDQELGAPRYRAAEQAMTLLARASKLVGGREGAVLVQTRQPDHEVLRAGLLGDPSLVSAAEAERRALLQLPPVATAAAVGGEAAPAFVEALTPMVGAGVFIDQRDDAQWLVRSLDQHALLDALNAVVRPPGRLRLQIDPARLPG